MKMDPIKNVSLLNTLQTLFYLVLSICLHTYITSFSFVYLCSSTENVISRCVSFCIKSNHYHVYDLSDNGNGIDHTNGTNGHGEQGEQRKFHIDIIKASFSV